MQQLRFGDVLIDVDEIALVWRLENEVQVWLRGFAEHFTLYQDVAVHFMAWMDAVHPVKGEQGGITMDRATYERLTASAERWERLRGMESDCFDWSPSPDGDWFWQDGQGHCGYVKTAEEAQDRTRGEAKCG